MGAWEIYKANDNKQAINRIRWIKASMISYRIKSTLKFQKQEAAKQFHLTSMELRTAFTSIFNHMDKDKSGSLSAIEFGKLLTTLAEHATAAQKREHPSAGNPDGSLQEGWVEHFDTNAGYKRYIQVDTGVSTWTRPVVPLNDILIDANSQIVVLKLFDQFGHFEGDGCIVRNEFLSIVLDVTSKRKKVERNLWADQSKAHTIISNIIWPLYRELQTTCTLIRMLFTQYDRARSEELNATDLYEMVSNISPEANFTPAETEAVLFSLDIDNDGRIQETELVSFIVDWLYMSPEEGKEFAEESPVHAKMVMFLSNLEHQINDMLLGNMKKLNITVDNDSAGRFRKTKTIRNQFANMANKAKTASVAKNVADSHNQTKLSQQKQLSQRQRISADRLKSRIISRSTTKRNNAATSATQVVPLKQQQQPPISELDDMSIDVGSFDVGSFDFTFKEVDEEDEPPIQSKLPGQTSLPPPPGQKSTEPPIQSKLPGQKISPPPQPNTKPGGSNFIKSMPRPPPTMKPPTKTDTAPIDVPGSGSTDIGHHKPGRTLNNGVVGEKKKSLTGGPGGAGQKVTRTLSSIKKDLTKISPTITKPTLKKKDTAVAL